MKTLTLCLLACGVTFGLASIALAVRQAAICYVPSQDDQFCKQLGEDFVGECDALTCAGLNIAIEREKFPIRADEADQGATTESSERCWRVLKCKEESKTGKCVSDPEITYEWKKSDKIVTNTDKKCPAAHDATGLEAVAD